MFQKGKSDEFIKNKSMFEMSKNLFYIIINLFLFHRNSALSEIIIYIFNYTNYTIHGRSIKLSDIGSTQFCSLLTFLVFQYPKCISNSKKKNYITLGSLCSVQLTRWNGNLSIKQKYHRIKFQFDMIICDFIWV